MTFDNKTRERLLAHCGEIHEDDCIDPRQFFRQQQNRRKEDRKTKQLCRQVRETLSMVLAGELSDERLQGLQVTLVAPSPNASQLAVTLCPETPLTESETDELMTCLGVITGHLRCEVAAAISRKRTPRLVFRIANETPDGRHCE